MVLWGVGMKSSTPYSSQTRVGILALIFHSSQNYESPSQAGETSGNP